MENQHVPRWAKGEDLPEGVLTPWEKMLFALHAFMGIAASGYGGDSQSRRLWNYTYGINEAITAAPKKDGDEDLSLKEKIKTSYRQTKAAFSVIKHNKLLIQSSIAMFFKVFTPRTPKIQPGAKIFNRGRTEETPRAGAVGKGCDRRGTGGDLM